MRSFNQFRLFVLFMVVMSAGMCAATNYFYIDDLDLDADELGTQITVPVRASFDTYISSWNVKFIFPEGLTPFSISKGADASQPYCDSNGRTRTTYGYIQVSLSKDHCMSSGIDLDYYYDEDIEDYELCGPVKWAPGVYNQMLVLKFNVSNDFSGGVIEVVTKATCGLDLRYNASSFYPSQMEYSEGYWWPGDVNGDGIDNVSDLTIIRDYIINDGNVEYDYFPGIADLHQDGVVDVLDVEKLTDLLIWGGWYEGGYVLHEGSATAVVSVPGPYGIGDINGDGVMNVTDVILLINLLLDGDLDSDLYYYCDINMDGVINISDATAMINILLMMAE